MHLLKCKLYVFSEKSKSIKESTSDEPELTARPTTEPVTETLQKKPDKSFLEAPFLELNKFESVKEETEKGIFTPEVPLRYEDPPKAAQGKLLR